MALTLPTCSHFAQSHEYSGSQHHMKETVVKSKDIFTPTSYISQWSWRSLLPSNNTVKAYLKHELWGPGFCLHLCNKVHLPPLDFFIHLQKPATGPVWRSRQSKIWLQDSAWTHCCRPHYPLIFCSGDKADSGKLNSPTATMPQYLRGWRD